MKKLLITLVMTTALVVPTAASAHGGRHHHHGWHHAALYAKLSGAGTLTSAHGSLASTKLGTGTFTSAVTPTGAAVSKTFHRGTLSCAPATAALSLVGSSTVTANLTGKSCTWMKAGSTTSTSMFWGKNVDKSMKGFLVQKRDGTVKGALFAGVNHELLRQFSVRLKDASHHTGDCDRH